MKYIGLIISSLAVLLVATINLYYNSVTLDIKTIKDYVVEANIILEDVIEKEKYVVEKKDEYISRLINLKSGIQNSKTTFLIKDYKNYKIKSIESLIETISNKDLESNNESLKDVMKYNMLSNDELEKIASKNLLE